MLRYLEQEKIYLKKSKPNKESLELLEQCKKLFNLLKKAYKEKSLQLLEKIHDLEKQITYKKIMPQCKQRRLHRKVLTHEICTGPRRG